MSQKLTLELPDEAYESLVQAGQEQGESPETVASQILAETFTDPLLKLSGCIKTAPRDISRHHDKYLGKELASAHDD